MKDKIVLLGMAALFAMVAITATVSAVPPAENVVWFEPADSSVQGYCNTTEVEVRANITNITGCAGGTLNLTYDPECANITDWELNPLVFPNGTCDTRFDGREWITFATLSKQTGEVLIGTLTIHCCNSTSSCTTPLTFIEGSSLRTPAPSVPMDVEWKNGTFTCGVSEKPDLVITDKWVCWPDNCTIYYNVTNTGNGTASAGHNSSLYVDGEEVAHDHVTEDMAPGENYTGCFDDYNWTYTSPGDNITVCADSNNTIIESNETNNCMTNIWMCGDVAPYPDCNEKVDMGDVILLLNNVSYPGNPRYVLECCC
jgi:hypothetical protein